MSALKMRCISVALLLNSIIVLTAAEPKNVKHNVRKSLVGIAVVGNNINLVEIKPLTLEVITLFKNVTTVSDQGITPKFSTAYCTDTENFLIAINDMGAPRVAAVDLRTGKVTGIVKVNGVYVDNLECDIESGFGMAYVFLLGYKHTVVKLDFSSGTHQVLMKSSYKSYGGSAIDSATGRLFTVAVLPHFDAFNYSISTLEYRKNREILSPPYRHYSIGDMVYDEKFGQPLAIIQTPPQIKTGLNYKTFLAVLDVCKGTVKVIAGAWHGQQPISNTGLTLDPTSHTAFVFMEKYIRAINVDSGEVRYEKSTKSLPWPVLYYQWIN